MSTATNATDEFEIVNANETPAAAASSEFRPIRRIAEGGNAFVWEAEWAGKDEQSKKQEVAIKSFMRNRLDRVINDALTGKPLSPEERLNRRLQRELHMLALVDHPNIDTCLKHLSIEENPVEPGGTPALVFPLRRRGHLLDYLSTEPNADKFKLLIQVAEALKYLHEFKPSPIVHLDIKPQNILVSDDGDAKLSDLGLAKVLDEGRTGLTTTTSIGFTLSYAPKEILAGEDYGPATDVYSFGYVILEVFSGLRPFYKIRHGPLVMLAIMNDTLPKKEDYPISGPVDAVNRIFSLVLLCCNANPSSRPTMRAVVAELRKISILWELGTIPEVNELGLDGLT